MEIDRRSVFFFLDIYSSPKLNCFTSLKIVIAYWQTILVLLGSTIIEQLKS